MKKRFVLTALLLATQLASGQEDSLSLIQTDTTVKAVVSVPTQKVVTLQKPSTEKIPKEWVFLLLGLGIGATCGTIAWVISRKKHTSAIKQMNIDWEAKYAIIQSENQSLQETIVSLREQLTKANEEIQGLKLQPVVTEQKAAVPTIAPEATQFFSVPEPEGWWYVASGKERFAIGASAYQLAVSSDGQTATFTVHNSPEAANKLTRSRTEGILPVCEETNAYQENARIQTLRPGTVIRQGEQWVLKEKARIAYV